MIYIDNTTEDQVIFIGRNIKSIENINPITLDSNYYTKVEVNELASNTLNQAKNYTDTEVLKLDTELENINEDIDVLEGRIIDLENNGGSSNPPIIIDLGIAVEPNLVLSKEEMIMIADNYMLRDIIIKSKTSSTINDERYFKVINVQDYRKGGYDRIVVYVGVFFDLSIAYYWEIDTERDTYASMKVFGFAKYTSDFEQIKTNTTAIGALDSRVTELENNGGGSSGGDTTELENRVTELENKTFNNTNSLENQIEALENRTNTIENTYVPQIEANATRIDQLLNTWVYDVSNGMTSAQFNYLIDRFKNKGFRCLLNVGNNDFFEMCSIQTANRSITAIGFDDYEGELMCYNWFAPNIASVPELTKRKIITEIV